MLEGVTFSHDGSITWYNGHEGNGHKIRSISDTKIKDFYVLSLVGEYALPNDLESKSVPFKIERDKTGKIKSLIFLDDSLIGNKKERYILVPGGLEKYLNQIMLEGKYKDENGNIYIFDSNCVAHWPDKEFTYVFNVDFMEQSCDAIIFFEEPVPFKKPATYGPWTHFIWKGGKLLIFKDNHNCDGKPSAVLTPQ